MDKSFVKTFAAVMCIICAGVVFSLFVIIGGVTLMDRGERWHCERYLKEVR